MNLAFVLLFLLAFSSFSQCLNICGGARDLDDVNVGEICDAGGYADCPFGTTTCSADLNAILCVPNCSITVRMVLEKNDTIIIPKCENKGYWDFFIEECVCPEGYLGPLCQIRDECHNVDCNDRGTCRNGACVCESDYLGSFCETHKNCRSFNVVWTGSECECAKGWEGPDCTQCLNTSICVPNKNLIGYTLLSIQNEFLYKILLETPAPPNWNNMQPYKPTPDKFQCQCSSFSAFLSSSQSSSSLIEGIMDVSHLVRKQEKLQSIESNIELNPYIEAFVEHHHHIHHAPHTDNTILYFFIGFIIFIFIIFGIIYYLSFEKKHASRSKRRTSKGSPTNR